MPLLQSATLADLVTPGEAAAASLAGALDLDVPRWRQLGCRRGTIALDDVPLTSLDRLARALANRVVTLTASSTEVGELIRHIWAARYLALSAAGILPALATPRPVIVRVESLRRVREQALEALEDVPPPARLRGLVVACRLVGDGNGHVVGDGEAA